MASHRDLNASTAMQLEQQKQVLVNAFTELAHSMRRAAQESQNMATIVANMDPLAVSTSDAAKLAFQQRNNAELSKIIQQNAPGGFGSSYMPTASQHPSLHTPISPASDQHTTPDLDVPSNGKKRPRAGTANGPGRGKKEKKAKDPLAPKRPASAYILYQNDVRKAMVERHPELSYREVLVEISKQWSELAPAQKQAYQQRVEQGKVVYEQQKAQYDREHPNGASGAPGSSIATPSPIQHIAAVPPPTGVPHPSVAALPASLPAVTSTSASSEGDDGSTDEEEEEEDVTDDDDEDGGAGSPPAKKHKSHISQHPSLPPIAVVQGRY